MRYLKPRLHSSFKRNFQEEYRFDEIECPSFDGACVLPYLPELNNFSGVVTSDGMFVEHSAVHESLENGKVDIKVNIVDSDHDAIFIGSMMSVYGHCITDNLKKLWFLRTDDAQEILKSGGKIVYVSAWDQEELPSYALRILELGGVDTLRLERISVPTRFKRVYVPENSMRLKNGIRQWSPLFRSEIETIKSNSEYSGELYDKVYFTRTALSDSDDYGEERIQSLFAASGYRIISPEKLSVDAQVMLMANCSHVVCTDGSVAHNAIFCNKDAYVTILLKSDYVNGYQMMINKMVGYNLTYVSANHTIRHRKPWAGPFYLSVTSYLSDFLGLSHRRDLYWLRPDWYVYLFHRFFR